jgi:hypothetical protein
MPNFEQKCPQEHKFHGSFTHELTTYDVYTFGTAINFCFRYGNEPGDYAGIGKLENILKYELYSRDGMTRKGLEVAANSDPEISNLIRQERHRLWNIACKLDDIDPNSLFVIFSDHNPAALRAGELPRCECHYLIVAVDGPPMPGGEVLS